MATVTRPRAEMDKACLWRLEDIFPTDEAFEKELEESGRKDYSSEKQGVK